MSLAAAVAGVLIPVWLWQTDLHGRSLQLKVISQASLKPDVANVPGLKITIDGVALDSPYISVVELSNDGKKPISTSEYESDIEISIAAGASLVRAHVSSVEPKDLQPKIIGEKAKFRLGPLLLNPNDKLTFSVLTTGGKPSFTTRARVAGISAIPVTDQSLEKPRALRTAFDSITGGLLLVLYFAFAFALASWRRYELSRKVIAFGVLATGPGAALLLAPIANDFAGASELTYFGVLGVAALLALFAAHYFVRKKPSASVG